MKLELNTNRGVTQWNTYIKASTTAAWTIS